MTFAQFLRKPFLTEHLRWLLLYMIILVTLLLILKICLSVEINFWKTPLKITAKNLRSFQGTYLWQSSILVKALYLRFTVIFLMILKLMVLRNFILEGVYTWNFITGWNSSRDEVIPFYGWWNVSYCLHVFVEIKFHPGMKDRDEISSRDEKKKRRVNTSSGDEI